MTGQKPNKPAAKSVANTSADKSSSANKVHHVEERIVRSKDGTVIKEVIKKISPYPIPVNITMDNHPVFAANIVRLEPIGFIMRFEAPHFFKVGEFGDVIFNLPVVQRGVTSRARVIKTYDGMEIMVAGKLTKTYTVEIHFVDLGRDERTIINKFLEKIGQKLP
jgi:hypothetical protein